MTQKQGEKLVKELNSAKEKLKQAKKMLQQEKNKVKSLEGKLAISERKRSSSSKSPLRKLFFQPHRYIGKMLCNCK